MNTHTIWVVDDDKAIRWVLEKALTKAGLSVTVFSQTKTLIAELKNNLPTLLITDIRMPGIDGLGLLAHMQQLYPQIPVIVMTAYSDLDSTVAAYQGGAFEYLSKPFDIDDAVELAQRGLLQCEQSEDTPTIPKSESMSELIGSAPTMQAVFRAIGRLSRSHITVLITGESGTGKELVAQALHRHSPRAKKTFIALNTAAIPHELLESELFGHERGAFTGALSQRRGRFEQADGGTLFLDEIGDMPAELQTRLLRVLADGTFFRVGGYTAIKVDVRIIAATHQNLKQHVKSGKFREDLYHRLHVIHIELPALRNRREDIPVLIQHFMQLAAQELGEEQKTIPAETMNYLSQLNWSGNVRELENVCRWLTVMPVSQEILLEDLPEELQTDHANEMDSHANSATKQNNWEDDLRLWADQALQQGNRNLLDTATPRFEKVLIEAALKHSKGHRQAAALLLGWGRNTIARKIKELALVEL